MCGPYLFPQVPKSREERVKAEGEGLAECQVLDWQTLGWQPKKTPMQPLCSILYTILQILEPYILLLLYTGFLLDVRCRTEWLRMVYLI